MWTTEPELQEMETGIGEPVKNGSVFRMDGAGQRVLLGTDTDKVI